MIIAMNLSAKPGVSMAVPVDPDEMVPEFAR